MSLRAEFAVLFVSSLTPLLPTPFNANSSVQCGEQVFTLSPSSEIYKAGYTEPGRILQHIPLNEVIVLINQCR